DFVGAIQVTNHALSLDLLSQYNICLGKNVQITLGTLDFNEDKRQIIKIEDKQFNMFSTYDGQSDLGQFANHLIDFQYNLRSLRGLILLHERCYFVNYIKEENSLMKRTNDD
ncbi:hypothetical protein ACJX0J_010567, partial [Zea mays]